MKFLLPAIFLCLAAGIAPSIADAPLSVTTTAPLSLTARDKKQMADEIKQGQEAADEIAKQQAADKTPRKDRCEVTPAMTDRVNQIGQRLALVVNTTRYPAEYGNDTVFPFVWHFHVLEDKEVNAFSLPGGQVYVNSGLLKTVRSDDELAGVLGHEMTHSAHHHLQALSHEQSKMSTEMIAGLIAAIIAHVPTRDIGNLAAGAQYTQLGILNIKYSQQAERDADHGGTIVMQKAGYNPVGMLTFMERLGDFENFGPHIDEGILQDHPEAGERIALITQELKQMNVPVTVSAVRQVTDAPHAAMHPAPDGGQDIVFANRTLPSLADPDGSRTKEIVARFNALLDNGLQLYQVSYNGGQVLVSDQPLIVMTPADLALHPGETPESLARAAGNALRSGIYAQTFTSAAL